ncbi:phage tail protein I [Verminephrobacter aporrectodeae subsp. tuberculatae]|uniref:phage tail protein I n=1 Tax=Verminephrobacter aporrectodeae TaxID=1110389 RepID=UPI002238CA3E|nr:phage tail protein I [Verminephrobacter aporrectodeae]MCW5223534.1 phage tail protein I [Verminephrobacter aporrectodeae subsp. tuberculatae]MCW5288999.1 phage tail protein I [Verminephrobacter aporrectodeae subsp. tuberculatae]
MADGLLLAPPLAGDARFRALGQLAARISDINLSSLLVYLVDTVHVSALSHLAEQFNVLGDAGWDFAGFGPATEAKKRALLKEAVALHRIKGTRYAVQRALDLMHMTARITEWWEQTPQGAPHTFLIDLLLTEAPAGQPVLSPERTDAVLRLVRFWKPVRSHFRARVGVGLATTTRSVAVLRPAAVIRADARDKTAHCARTSTASAVIARPAQPVHVSAHPGATRMTADCRTRSCCALRLTQRRALMLLPTVSGAPQ